LAGEKKHYTRFDAADKNLKNRFNAAAWLMGFSGHLEHFVLKK